jgi:citrate lyase subunit beta / citryl-CoA lyase
MPFTTVRPRRSVLYIPGSNPKALEKGRTLPADALILDLEDAVSPDAKPQGRTAIAAALVGREAYGRRELVVRVNSLESEWGRDDLTAMATVGADAILLPKVETESAVEQAAEVLAAAGARAEMPLWCMIETPRGVLNALAIADHARVACLVMGTSDLTKDLHARHTAERLPMLAALGHCLLAARAGGCGILDGVHLDLKDQTGFEAACRQGRELGFDGKTLIHPRQIDAANCTFGPSAEELAEARGIIEAFEAAQAAGKGVVVRNGRLVENLHVMEAQRLLALAAAIESP